ncbi:MAG: hypothetical protein H6867_08745 [Rhodospirillales bacterium]|nr:hypothetical protein [Rhodospirillales bacterium]MCB9995642.1 hypothetical protein [Rhodospirillales bacterium]
MSEPQSKSLFIEFEPAAALADGLSRPADVSFDTVYDGDKRNRGEGAAEIKGLVDREAFSKDSHIFVNDFVMKQPGSLTHRIPKQYKQFEEMIRLVAAFEAAHSPCFKHRKGVITIRQSHVNAGFYQIGLTDWHQDRIGPRRDERLLVDHIYVASDRDPGFFQKKPMADAYERLQQNDDKDITQAKSHTVYMFNNYAWHRTSRVWEDGVRTFVRISYESPDSNYIENCMDRNERTAPKPS